MGEQIARDLAAMSSSDVSVLDGWQIDSWCLFCEAKEVYDLKNPTAHHEPTCIWRRAVELSAGSNERGSLSESSQAAGFDSRSVAPPDGKRQRVAGTGGVAPPQAASADADPTD